MKHQHEKTGFWARLASFKFAFQGLLHMLKNEPNFRIHLIGAVTAIFLGVVLHIGRAHWLIIILCIGFVLVAEIMNTAIEELVDIISPMMHEKAGRIKDLAAGGVLVAAFTALVAGMLVFIPYIVK